MITINLRDFYYWYREDEFIEVTDEVAEELRADVRYHKSYMRRVYYNRAQYSLDVGDGIENEAVALRTALSPHQILEMKERYCNLCRALNSLPEIQGRRVEAYYLLKQKQREIAQAEGVSAGTVAISIRRGLQNMREYWKSIDREGEFLPPK